MKLRSGGAVLLFAFAVGCASEGAAPRPRGPSSIMVDNQSQYILEELRTHSTTQYIDAANVLETPMAINGTHLVHAERSVYVTVIRERNRGGPMLAFTTSRPLELTAQLGYRLLVFDDSFRLQDDEYVAPEQMKTEE